MKKERNVKKRRAKRRLKIQAKERKEKPYFFFVKAGAFGK
jgi:hypothetical protein